MAWRVGLVTLLSVMGVSILAGVGVAELQCTWCNDDFTGDGGGGETWNATLEPDDGKYLNRTDDNVYYYDSTAGSLTLLEENSQETQEGENQAGECEYALGSWTDSSAEYTYGRCINLRTKDNSKRELHLRINVREIDSGPYQMVVDIHFLDSEGNSTGDATREATINCFSDATAEGHEVTLCEEIKYPTVEDSDLPSDAEKWCARGGLLEYENGDYQIRLEVTPPCHDV